jgi:hypothetical protein
MDDRSVEVSARALADLLDLARRASVDLSRAGDDRLGNALAGSVAATQGSIREAVPA